MLLPPPPPHETIVIVTAARISRQIPRIICFLSTTKTMEKNIPAARIQLEEGYGRCCRRTAVVGAVVVTVTVAVVVETTPFGFKDAGENEHVASEGNPEQASVIVPVKFVELEMAMAVVPELPAVWMNTAG